MGQITKSLNKIDKPVVRPVGKQEDMNCQCRGQSTGHDY